MQQRPARILHVDRPLKPAETDDASNERPGRVRAFWNWLRRTAEPRGAEPLSRAPLDLIVK